MTEEATVYLQENFGVTSIADLDPTIAHVIMEGAEMSGDGVDREISNAYFAHHHMKRMTSIAFAQSDLFNRCLRGMGLGAVAA